MPAPKRLKGPVMRIRLQPILAMMMFAVCVGIGLIADAARREAIDWFAHDGSTSSARLQLAFREEAE